MIIEKYTRFERNSLLSPAMPLIMEFPIRTNPEPIDLNIWVISISSDELVGLFDSIGNYLRRANLAKFVVYPESTCT